MYSPIPSVIPDGVTAYAGELDDDKLVLTQVETAVPAYTGVVLTGTANTYTFNKATAEVSEVTSDLTGTTTSILTSSVDGDVYTLQRHDFNDDNEYDGIAFKKYVGETITAGKAYLVLPAKETAQGANALRICFANEEDNEDEDLEEEETTSVDDSEFIIQNSELIFDLTGRRVENPTKGVYVINGRKVVIK